MSKTIRIPITNTLLGGDYTGQIQVGSNKTTVNVILDTGSSTLALDHKAYNPTQDAAAKKTNLVQSVQYGSGSWIGSVVQTSVTVGGAAGATLAGVNLAVAFHESAHMFGKAQGILGLAYQVLDDAFELNKSSLPPTYSANDVQTAQHTNVEPYFTQLAAAGLVASKYAFYTKRSFMRASGGSPAADPANSGVLILGGGEEATDLYHGAFQNAVVLSDDWYSTNLKHVIVGTGAPIKARRPSPSEHRTSPTNSIVDSGTNGIYLAPELCDDVLAQFSPDQQAVLRAGGSRDSNFSLAQWPNLTFVLQGDTGDVKLIVKPENYLQRDATQKGLVLSTINRGDGVQSILGLPLMNGYLTIFDDAANHGMGLVKFASAK